MTQKQILLFYINNLIKKSSVYTYSEHGLLSFVLKNSKLLFGYDISKGFSNPEEDSDIIEKDDLDELFDTKLHKNNKKDSNLSKQNFEILKKFLLKRKYIDIQARGQNKYVDSIADLFDLNENYRKLLCFFISILKTPLLQHFYNKVFDARLYKISFDYNELKNISALTNIPEQKVEELCSPEGKLVQYGILTIHGDDINLSDIFVKKLGSNIKNSMELKKALIGNTLSANKSLSFEHLEDEYNHIKKLLGTSVKKNISGINILLYGEPGTGKTEMAKHIVSSLGFDLYGMQTSVTKRMAKANNLAFLLRALHVLSHDKNSVILADEAEDIFRTNPFSEDSVSKLYINRLLEQNKRPVIWTTNSIRYMDPAYIRRFTYCCELKRPTENKKSEIWQTICQKHKLKISDDAISEYAKKYDVSPSIIDTAIRAAKMIGETSVISKTIDSLCLAMTGKKANNSKKDDIAFDTKLVNTDINIENLITGLEHGNVDNFSLCLYGISGTGKSAYACYLAEKLGKKIIKKRASDLKSAFVGETEQNIAKAFREAEASNSILLFDEADSFLRDRKYAHQSHEVSAVNEMLTQMENTNVPFICTTNLMSDIDSASLRRFTFKIKYDFMTAEQVKHAFYIFFGITPTDKDISNLKYLAPGDFVVVRKKAKILNITDLNEITELLAAEMSVKTNIPRTNPIGF